MADVIAQPHCMGKNDFELSRIESVNAGTARSFKH